MKWSLRVARVSGIDIKVHASFLLVVIYFAAMFGEPHGPKGAAFGTLLVTLLFTCVVLHELGHSLVAQQVGVQVREIVLLPIGGLARLEREPSRPLHELLIAVAGPLVNVVIAFVLASVTLATLGPETLLDGRFFESMSGPPSARGLLAALLWTNVGLAVFNMIPALPMDGGRVFRAILAMLMTRSRATRVAATVGQLLAAGIAALGIFTSSVWLAIIGAFVFLGAGQERAMAAAHDALSGLTAGDACDPQAQSFAPGEELGSVIDTMLRSPQTDYAVMHGETLVGIVSRDELLERIADLGLGAFVSGIMRREIPVLDASMPLEKVRAHLAGVRGHVAAVFGPHGFLGLLSLGDVARIASLIGALRRRGVVRPEAAPRAAPYL